MVASVAMRRLLIDYARARRTEKRGGQYVRGDIETAEPSQDAQFADLIEIDDLLSQLATSDRAWRTSSSSASSAGSPMRKSPTR